MLLPGFLVDRYEIVRLVAVGGMCHVYEARAENTVVAVKVLQPIWAADPEIRRRFMNEANLLRALDHPHLVRVEDVGALRDGEPYMILQWLPHHLGQTLAENGAALTPSRVLRISMQLARALLALHERGIWHRDIKAANVLFDVDDLDQAQFRLADLGLAKMAREQSDHSLVVAHVSTGGGVLLGTWDYMAPEQWIKSKTVDDKADVYSLGVLMFQMLAKRLPFVAEQAKDLMQLHLFIDPPMKRIRGKAPEPLEQLIERMLQKVPKARPTMREVLSELEAMQ